MLPNLLKKILYLIEVNSWFWFMRGNERLKSHDQNNFRSTHYLIYLQDSIYPPWYALRIEQSYSSHWSFR